jgi:hypothetical protein
MDGNCLYNAVALVLVGDEGSQSQLRLLTVIEMILYREYYENSGYVSLIFHFIVFAWVG